MSKLKKIALQIENKTKSIEKYESFIRLNPLSCIVSELEISIIRLKKEKENLQKEFDLIELN